MQQKKEKAKSMFIFKVWQIQNNRISEDSYLQWSESGLHERKKKGCQANSLQATIAALKTDLVIQLLKTSFT